MADLGAVKIPPAITAALLEIASLEWRQAPRFVLEAAANWGSFEGDLLVRLLNSGRLCELLANYVYIRNDGSRWVAPKGIEVDGASIPRIFWSLIGGPLEGKYRNASVIHDHYCESKERGWRDVHRVFYEAMRCNEVGAAQAKVMYYAVYRFGPRWPDKASPTPETPARIAPQTLPASIAPSLLADAEAIYTHDLSLDAIDHLADAREVEQIVAEGAVALEGPETNAARARALVVCGGSGTPDDLDAVAREAALLPGYVLKRFERDRIRIIACREAITDFEADLRGKTPRGWESTGRTWDSVPGTYFHDRRRVVIATIAEGGKRIVPRKETRKHGSDSLVVHESLHGFDYLSGHEVLRERRFTRAREKDFPKLGTVLDGYLVQPGQAGLEETFAESGARAVVDETGIEADWPNLAEYWHAGPGDIESVGATPVTEAPAGDRIGNATIRSDGSIRLDLRAEGPGGAIGHATLEYPADDPEIGRLKGYLLSGAPMPEGVGGEIRVPFIVD